MKELTPRFSPEPDPLPIERAKAALEARVPELGDAEAAKKTLATVLGLTLAGESVKAIGELLNLTRGQVEFAQRVLRHRGDLANQAQIAITRFKDEGIVAAIESAEEKIKAGDSRFVERMLEEGGVWSKKGSGGDGEGATGAVNPGLPALTINVVQTNGSKADFGTVHAHPKTIDGASTAVQHRK